MGGQDQDQPQSNPDNSAKAEAFMKKCQAMDQELQDHAREFPEFAPSAKVARDAIGKSMQKVVAVMGRGQDVPAPQVPY